MTLAVSTVDLARAQFAMTSLYHFLFVPLTLGLAPLVAVMQTLWYRSRDEAWLRLTRFFGTLMLINFAIGVATGLVQEFQFGMNWSVYSEFVGDVFGAPLAIEGLAAFMLESTFLGLWIFGWDRLSPRVHLATVWLFALGSWLSALFIIVANSWMQRPVGSDVVNGRAELTSIWDLLTNRLALWAYGHVLMVGITTASAVIFGVACWHIVRGRNQDLFRKAAKLALIVGVPISALNLWWGSHLGIVITDYQPMKIAATEALWDTEQPAAFSIFQIGGFTKEDQTPSFEIEIPKLLSFLATGSFNGEVQGLNPLQQQEERDYGRGNNYMPPVETTYWSMRVMAYLGSLVFLVFGGRRPSLVAQEVRDEQVVLVDRRLRRSAPVSGRTRRLDVDRDRPAALDRLGPAPDGRRELPERVEHDDRAEPRRVRPPLSDADRPQLRPPAPLRALRPARGRR